MDQHVGGRNREPNLDLVGDAIVVVRVNKRWVNVRNASARTY